MAPKLVVPQGKTFFEIMKRSFVDVPIDKDNGNAIATSEFLDAAESFKSLFDLLESTSFGMVEKDMKGNITKVRTRLLAAPLESETLQDLVRNELKSKKKTASEGLLWLTRSLEFTCKSLQMNLQNPSEELATSFKAAYKETLYQHHYALVRPGFQMTLSLAPYRKDLYKSLGEDEEKVKTEAEEWLAALENIVEILKAFLATVKI